MTTMNQPPFDLDEVVSVGERPGGSARVRPAARVGVTGYRLARRGALKATVALGTGAGMAALGLFPKAKEASAACVGFLEADIFGGCPTEVGDCSPACGPSTVYADTCGSNGLHMYTGNYRNRPDQCHPGTESDGWHWTAPTGSCGCQPGFQRNYRCHDGCKLISGAWRNSICRTSTPCFG
jgi:hypothetical protein